MKAQIAFAVCLATGLMACGGGHSGCPAANSPAAASALVAPGEAKIGDRTKCPKSGEEFTVTATSPKAEHNGKTYYFCCAGCANAFKANPEKYIHKG